MRHMMKDVRWRRFRKIFSVSSFLMGFIVLSSLNCIIANSYTGLDKNSLRLKAKEMFMHGYNSYMEYAYPDDDLMPLTCKGRKRGITPTRGDIDDALGNFSLTLVDSLDTLVVVGEYDEFENAVRKVVKNVRFDSDLVVSVFETNIRMVGGLISAHLMSSLVKNKREGSFLWYTDQLLKMAEELAERLLPAFNTTSGLPHPRINLKKGLTPELKLQQHTCTACGGTMILEWIGLSRLSGNPIFEEKARKAMDFLWNQRHGGSDLVGTIINVNSGDWIRRDSGIGAGIDSYYEYLLKAYILLGEDNFLHRFNKHYEAVMKHLNKGPMFIDVHMHKPNIAIRSHMDSLMAFWPGVQVLKGDLKAAIELHEMLFNVIKRHKFLPEGFTHDLQIHWVQHHIRPEFLESTYFLYRATKDPYYLNVARQIMESLEENVRVYCGFAAVKDLRTMDLDDQMESFVLAETFKYLYMIFAEPDDFLFDPDDYVFTTEAHFLPLSLGEVGSSGEDKLPRKIIIDPDEIMQQNLLGSGRHFNSACPITENPSSPDKMQEFGQEIRQTVNSLLNNANFGQTMLNQEGPCLQSGRLDAYTFSPSNLHHLEQLRKMGIQVEYAPDGRMHFSHTSQSAENAILAFHGFLFMQEMINYALKATNNFHSYIWPGRTIQVVSEPHFGDLILIGSHAQFGANLSGISIESELSFVEPQNACTPLENPSLIRGKIALVRRGGCLFEQKVKNVQLVGALAAIVIDNNIGSSIKNSPFFWMSADRPDEILIPSIFLFHLEGQKLINLMAKYPTMVVRIGDTSMNKAFCFERFLKEPKFFQRRKLPTGNFIINLDLKQKNIHINLFFGNVTAISSPEEHQMLVELNLEWISECVFFHNDSVKKKFINYIRILAYSSLGYKYHLNEADFDEFYNVVQKLQLLPFDTSKVLDRHKITKISCKFSKPSACDIPIINKIKIVTLEISCLY